jgi:putative ABC transport system ATP-binding protein
VLALFQELNNQGVTILLVTHELDISQYAQRIVELRDGLVIRDEPVEDRHHAAYDLEQLAGPAGVV